MPESPPEYQMPESVWNDPQALLYGLNVVNQGIFAYLQNIVAVHQGTAKPHSAITIAALGNAMVEVGNALQGRLINTIPGDFLTPPIFTDPR